MPLPLRALLVEDCATDAELIVRELRRAGFAPEWHRVDTEAELIAYLHADLDIILSDYVMPTLSGLRALEVVNESGLEIPFILISGTIGEDTAVAAMKQGATDYLLKDRLARLGPAVHGALAHGQMRRERKQAEAALRESEARFRQLAENIQEVFWLTDPTMTQMFYLSPAYEKIWGRSCAELCANPRSWLDAIHPDDRERVIHAAETKLPRGEYDEEYRIIRPDGSQRWIRDCGFPVTDADRAIVRIAGVARDITERKEAEASLRLFRTLVDQSNDTFEVIDPETGRFLDVNERGCVELGYSRAEYLSRRVFDMVPTLDHSTWLQSVERIHASGALSGEGHQRRKDGSTFPIEFSAKWVQLDRSYIVTVVRNITERKKLEAEVALREQRLNAFFTGATAGLVLLDADLRFIQINATLAKINGLTPEEHIGRTVREILPKFAPVVAPLLRQVLRTGQPILSIELAGETPRRPGVLQHWMESFFPIAGINGQPDGIGGIVVDITERKRAEEALRLFRTLVDQSSDTFEVIDPETARFLDINERGCVTLGYSRAEILKLTVFDVDPEVSESDWPQAVARMRGDGCLNREVHRRRKDGSLFPGELNAKWVWLDREYIIAVVRDITERKRAEERIREQAAMLNQAHEAIIVRDLHTRRITFWNQGAERLYGWSAAEAEGRHIGELIHADAAGPKEVTEHLLKTGEWRGEHKHVTKAGKSLTVSSHATLVRDEEGKPKSALVINIDITEQKNLEARYLRAQRMESIGTLASGVAHDLNNILSPILLTAPMLRLDLTAEEREEIISTIELSADRGAQIVKQVLTFGRGLEGERLPLQIESVIKEITKLMRETFPKNITIESRGEARLWPVMGDATQIHQILLNLCVNARDAMPEGGRLRLHAANLEVDANFASMLPEAVPGPHVLLEVSDTGEGIPPEIIERIFDPFFTTKAAGKGTGLGLSTVIGIVKSHGGSINLSSKPGAGSTFQVYLPAEPAQEQAPARPSQEKPPRAAGELVLVVDDEEVICGAARMALEARGYRVLLAPNGVEALAIFALNSSSVAAVITDLMMPVMDGVALTRALRAMDPRLPIIASTGLGEKAQMEELKRLNVHSFLAKPYGVDVLLRTVHDTLHPAVGAAPLA